MKANPFLTLLLTAYEEMALQYHAAVDRGVAEPHVVVCDLDDELGQSAARNLFGDDLVGTHLKAVDRAPLAIMLVVIESDDEVLTYLPEPTTCIHAARGLSEDMLYANVVTAGVSAFVAIDRPRDNMTVSS